MLAPPGPLVERVTRPRATAVLDSWSAAVQGHADAAVVTAEITGAGASTLRPEWVHFAHE